MSSKDDFEPLNRDCARAEILGLPKPYEIFTLYHLDGKPKNLRFGQWFYVKFDYTNKPNPELFYERDQKKAYDLIMKQYYKSE